MKSSHQEKKYQVESFEGFIKILNKLEAKNVGGKVTYHYYGQHQGSGVTKLVKYEDKTEIHVLKEVDGKFDLIENIYVESVESGLEWLKNKGYISIDILKMENVDYDYKEGRVRLYTIDDWLKSVILDYPKGKHEKIAKELGLSEEDQIKVPYNKQLETLGKLRSRTI